MSYSLPRYQPGESQRTREDELRRELAEAKAKIEHLEITVKQLRAQVARHPEHVDIRQGA